MYYILFRVSYLEICNEKINDLLNKNQVDLKLYKDDNGQIIIKCKEEIANSANYMLSIMKEGIKNKKIQEKNRNEHIYSHSIFKIVRLYIYNILLQYVFRIQYNKFSSF